MDRAKRNHELEVETWSEKREQVTDELEQLQVAMIADGTIWSEDNTSHCATLIGDLKFIKVKLHELESYDTMEKRPAAAKTKSKVNPMGNGNTSQHSSGDARKRQAPDDLSGRFAGLRQSDCQSGMKRPPVIVIEDDDAKNQNQSNHKRQKTSVASVNNGSAGPSEDDYEGQARSLRAREELNVLEKKLLKFRIRANDLILKPPLDSKEKERLYHELCHAIFNGIILKLDQVEAGGEDRIRRKDLVMEADWVLDKLKGVVDASKVWIPDESMRTKDPARNTAY